MTNFWNQNKGLIKVEIYVGNIVTGDNRKDIYRKFISWLHKPYKAAIFKDWTAAPLETPVETFLRINESMVKAADTVLLFSDLQNECNKKLGIKFPIPRMKSGKKHLSDKSSDYFYGHEDLQNRIYASFPNTMNYLTNI